MTTGCIGEHLKHSFSREVHNALGNFEYEIKEIPRDELDSFMVKKEFEAINVTIPYKELVIPHLFFIDEHAKAIGAVNTIVNREGKLYGYNTDFYGMCALLSHAGVELKGKKVAILGTGGTSKTAFAVSEYLSAKEILTVSRSKREGIITYDELYTAHSDTEVIINTTPVGMYPNIFSSPVELSRFPALTGVIDAVYNPLRTQFICEAKKRGIAAEGGLYMLVAQAVRAAEIFKDISFEKNTLDSVFGKISGEKQNIVLIGMPSSGKSTVGGILADKLGRELIDTDAFIVERAKMPIPEIFSTYGEKRFREIESEVINEVSARTGAIIATGGGAPLKRENVDALSQNGRIYFIDRPLEKLIPTDDRPLSSTKEAVEKRYAERYDIYVSSSDVKIDASSEAEAVADKILEDFLK